MKLKELLKEAVRVPTMPMISASNIYDFYFLWYTAVNAPSLVQTPYGNEVMTHYLAKWKEKYIRIFRDVIAKQISNYISGRRVDADFPKNVDNLDNLSSMELVNLMKKTYRSDMVRRNDAWNLAGEFLIKLENATTSKDIFVYINQLNNLTHNTGGQILDKMPNYYSEMLAAFEVVSKATNVQLQLKGLVSKDIRDLWNQEDESGIQEIKDECFTERIMMREGLERILRFRL
jgi:hypothetical protein